MTLRAVQLVAQRGGVAVTELASELQVARSTAHRVLANCVATGYVRQEHSGGRYVAGPALYEVPLRMSSAVAIHDVVAPILTELRTELDLTTSIGVLEGRSVRFASFEGHGVQPLGSRLGQVRPAHSVAGGKAMLAFCSSDELARRYPGRDLTPVTERTITEWDEFLHELRMVRTRGWATSVGESEPVVNSVGVPIMTASGDSVAAISVAAYAPRLGTDSEVLQVVRPLVGAASRLQWLLYSSRLPAPQLPHDGSV